MSAVGAGLRTEDSPDLSRRVLVLALVLLAIVVAAVLLFRGDGGYTVTAEFVNAGQLVKGNKVKAGGATVGSVKSIDVTQNGTAKVDFSIADSMITNFHMPESTLLMMVAAFGGYDHVWNAYKVAIKEKYRFFSYGDAMLII